MAVDIRGLEEESSLRRGIGRYVLNLLTAITARAHNLQVLLLGNRVPWSVPHLAPLLESPHVRYSIWCAGCLDTADLLLLTDPAPVARNRPLIPDMRPGLPWATIFYDLIPLVFERQYLEPNPQLQREYMQRLDELCAGAARFLTISQFVADDVVSRLAVERERVLPIMGGLDPVFRTPAAVGDVEAARKKLGLHGEYFLYAGGIDFRKNIPLLLRAFQHLRRTDADDIQLVLAGEMTTPRLTQIAGNDNLIAGVMAAGHVDDADLRALYTGATAFVFPSLYEGFGLPALEAMACGCPVIAADSSSLREIVGAAGLLVDPNSAPAFTQAMATLRSDAGLRVQLRTRGLQRAAEFTWDDVADSAMRALLPIAQPGKRLTAPNRKLRVCIQNRENALHAPGGDTVVMEQIYRTLKARTADVELAAGSADLTGFDVIHLVNLTVANAAEAAAANAARSGAALVITTLFEDWPRYLQKSLATVRLFADYLHSGKRQDVFERGMAHLRSLPPAASAGHAGVVAQAERLLACGASEAERLAAAYPEAADRIRIVKFGISSGCLPDAESVAAVRSVLGFERYVLCCGRLETRKNQLMLLKALEDCDLPLVLASGGFTYQPAYADLITRYNHRAPVKILGRLSEYFLVNLMAGAAVHVLPSWYELPGLVSLEAARAGVPVAVSDWGAIRDYVPDDMLHFCRPDNPESIRAAVAAAIRQGPHPDARALANRCTWSEFGEATLRVYEEILTRPAAPPKQTASITNKQIESETAMTSVQSGTDTFDVSIIIPLHNRSELTRKCMESLSSMADHATHELVLVDNNSTDETTNLLQALEGDVTVLRLSANRGFAAACNLGARVARGRYLVFLNNDTVVHNGWLDAMVNCAREDDTIGVVGALLLYPEGDVQHAGIAFNDEKIPYHIFQKFAAAHPAVNERRDMQAVTGACMLVPRDLFLNMNGFDEQFHNGFEDIDYCLRLREHARRVVYCPQAIVTHHEEASPGRKTFDQQNLQRFLNVWQDAIASDERDLLRRHGYSMTWTAAGGRYERLEAKAAIPVILADPEPVDNLDTARALYEAGNLEDAARTLQALVENRMTLAGEDSFETWQTLGNCLARLNRLDEAETAYHQAIRLNEASERPFLGLGTVEMLRENWQAAMYGFMTALAKNPDTVKAEFGVGLSLAARSLHNDAVERFERVIRRDPENGEALFYLYKSCMESGQPRRTIEPLQAYLEKHPDDTAFMFNLCGAYWKAGELTRALELCQQVIKRESDHAAAHDVMEHLRAAMPVNA